VDGATPEHPAGAPELDEEMLVGCASLPFSVVLPIAALPVRAHATTPVLTSSGELLKVNELTWDPDILDRSKKVCKGKRRSALVCKENVFWRLAPSRALRDDPSTTADNLCEVFRPMKRPGSCTPHPISRSGEKWYTGLTSR